MCRLGIVLALVCALAAEVSAAGGAVMREVPATDDVPAHLSFSNGSVSLKVFPAAGGMVEGCTNLCGILPFAPTNECVAWRCVRGRRGEKTLWLGRRDGGGDRIVGLTLARDFAPLRVETLKPGGAAQLVREAYQLRLLGATNQTLCARSSKTLRMADRSEPLDVWNAIERAFLEDDGEGAAAKAALYNSDPVPKLLAAIDGYASLGAWHEVHELARQAVALAAENPAFAHPKFESLAKQPSNHQTPQPSNHQTIKPSNPNR